MYKSNFIAIVSIVAAASLFVGMVVPTAFAAQHENMTMMMDNSTMMPDNMTMMMDNSTMMPDNMTMSMENSSSLSNVDEELRSGFNASVPLDNSTMESMANGTVSQ
ncbi:MAG: hypothetical protein H0X03_05630 [Nitrosopumilus sp.]|nr:hypothetical protein [Nitrosopumilus sp.]